MMTIELVLLSQYEVPQTHSIFNYSHKNFFHCIKETLSSQIPLHIALKNQRQWYYQQQHTIKTIKCSKKWLCQDFYGNPETSLVFYCLNRKIEH